MSMILPESAGAASSPEASLKPPSMKMHLARAFEDLGSGLRDWRMWVLLGTNDIRQRYRRSRLGQFWITLAMATTIVSLGILYAFLFKISLREYLPYMGTNFVVWGLISGIVTESCVVFISAEGYLRQTPMPKSVFVHRMLVRNSLIFLHNLVILPPLFLVFDVPVSWALLLAPLGVALILLNGIWVGLLLGALCARFRDLPQIVGNLMQVVYFLTPVMWKPSQLPTEVSLLVDLNPFQSFLALVRDPLMGSPPPLHAWKMALAVTVFGYAIAILFFARFRARIVYWL
jgi:ABC-type polysaccharide/polyol phosphate export permease